MDFGILLLNFHLLELSAVIPSELAQSKEPEPNSYLPVGVTKLVP
jgi:hypothetical protein